MKPILLVVDDEPDILTLLSSTLTAEGFDVRICTTAASFREINQREDVSLYLIDVNLPDGNGFSLVRELRAEAGKGIILLTGRSSETDHVIGLEIGADDYVTKPFRLRELTARVNAVFRRTAQQTEKTAPSPGTAKDPTEQSSGDHHFDGYRLNESQRCLWDPKSQEIDLTTAEYQLLLALIQRRGEPATRDMLMQSMKGRHWHSDDRTIDGLVSRLRRKLPRRGKGGPYIRTVHGIGYSFSG